MEYTCNKVSLPAGDILVLMKDQHWDGRGYCCGYYASEFYTDGVIIAFRHPDGTVIECYDKFTELRITHSDMSAGRFTADNDKAAIEIFREVNSKYFKK